jgi:hypothetical protein
MSVFRGGFNGATLSAKGFEVDAWDRRSVVQHLDVLVPVEVAREDELRVVWVLQRVYCRH